MPWTTTPIPTGPLWTTEGQPAASEWGENCSPGQASTWGRNCFSDEAEDVAPPVPTPTPVPPEENLWDYITSLGLRVIYATDANIVKGDLIVGGQDTLLYQGAAGTGLVLGVNAYTVTNPLGSRICLASDPADEANAAFWWNTSSAGKLVQRWECGVQNISVDLATNGLCHICSYLWVKNSFAVTESIGRGSVGIVGVREGVTFNLANVNTNQWCFGGANRAAPGTAPFFQQRGVDLSDTGPVGVEAAPIFGLGYANFAAVPLNTEMFVIAAHRREPGSGDGDELLYGILPDGAIFKIGPTVTTFGPLGGLPPTLTSAGRFSQGVGLDFTQVFGQPPDSRTAVSILFEGVPTEAQCDEIARQIAIGLTIY